MLVSLVVRWGPECHMWDMKVIITVRFISYGSSLWHFFQSLNRLSIFLFQRWFVIFLLSSVCLEYAILSPVFIFFPSSPLVPHISAINLLCFALPVLVERVGIKECTRLSSVWFVSWFVSVSFVLPFRFCFSANWMQKKTSFFFNFSTSKSNDPNRNYQNFGHFSYFLRRTRSLVVTRILSEKTLNDSQWTLFL